MANAVLHLFPCLAAFSTGPLGRALLAFVSFLGLALLGAAIAVGIGVVSRVRRARVVRPAAEPTRDPPHHRVLVVEDHATVREAYIELLHEAGFTPTAVTNGTEALQRIRAGLAPDCILLDLMGTGGRDLVLALRTEKAHAAIPLLVVSGCDLEDGDPLRRCAAILRKPVGYERLVHELKRIMSPAPGTHPLARITPIHAPRPSRPSVEQAEVMGQ